MKGYSSFWESMGERKVATKSVKVRLPVNFGSDKEQLARSQARPSKQCWCQSLADVQVLGYMDYIGIMENKMDTMGTIGVI